MESLEITQEPRGMEAFGKNLEFGPLLVVEVVGCVFTMGIRGWRSRRGRMGVLQQQDVHHLPPTGGVGGATELSGRRLPS